MLYQFNGKRDEECIYRNKAKFGRCGLVRGTRRLGFRITYPGREEQARTIIFQSAFCYGSTPLGPRF